MSYGQVVVDGACLLALVLACLAIAVYSHHYFHVSRRRPGEPPMAPTSLPYVGHALYFGRDAQGFMKQLSSEYRGAFTLLLAGNRTTIVPVFDAAAIYRATSLQFDPIADGVSSRAFGVSYLDFGLDYEWVNRSYRRHLQGAGLLGLTQGFLEALPAAFSSTSHEDDTVPLYSFILNSIFMASCTALFGASSASTSNLRAFCEFDDSFPILVSGIPASLMPSVQKARYYIRSIFSTLDDSAHEMMHERDAKLREQALRDKQLGGHGGGAGEQSREAMQSEILWAAEANTVPAAFWCTAYILRDDRAYGVHRLVRQEGLEALGRALLRRMEQCRAGYGSGCGDSKTRSSVGKSELLGKSPGPATAAAGDLPSGTTSPAPSLAAADASASRNPEQANIPGYLPHWVPRSVPDLLSLLQPRDLDGLAVLDSAITETLRLTAASLTVRVATKPCTLTVGKARRELALNALKAAGLGPEDALEGEIPEVESIKIRKGDHVALFPPILHRDPAVFPDPDDFVFDRHADTERVSAIRRRAMAMDGQTGTGNDEEAQSSVRALAAEEAKALPAKAVERKHQLRIRLKPGCAPKDTRPGQQNFVLAPAPKVGGDSVVMPFGGGRSKCPGRMFARNEIRLATLLMVMLQRAELVADSKASTAGSASGGAWPELDKTRAGLGVLPPADRDALRVRLKPVPAAVLAKEALAAVGMYELQTN